jgi:hypothetical protein
MAPVDTTKAETEPVEEISELVCVRRRDVHEQQRHPVRRTVAFLVDAGLHLAVALSAWRLFATAVPDAHFWWQVEVAVTAYALVSGAHRVFLQWLIGATIGKALLVLCLVMRDTRDRPELMDLIRDWLVGCAMIILLMPTSLVMGLLSL